MAEKLEKYCYSIERVMGSDTNDNPFGRFMFFTLVEDENERLFTVGVRQMALLRFRCSVEVYSPKSGKWKELNIDSDGPGGLTSYSTVHYNKSIYLFGGEDKFTRQTTNDLWRFSFETFQWSKVAITNAKPFSRYCHASFVIAESKMLVFGGGDGKGHYFPDMWALDLKELEAGKGQWSWIDISGLPNGAIVQSHCCKLNSQTIVLCDLTNFVWKFDWKTKSWIKLTRALDHLNLFYLARWNEKIHLIFGNRLKNPFDTKESRPRVYSLNLDVVSTNKFRRTKLTEIFPANAKSHELIMNMVLGLETPCVPTVMASNDSHVFAALDSNGGGFILHRIKFGIEKSPNAKCQSKVESANVKSEGQAPKTEPDLNYLSKLFFDKIVKMKLEEEKQ